MAALFNQLMRHPESEEILHSLQIRFRQGCIIRIKGDETNPDNDAVFMSTWRFTGVCEESLTAAGDSAETKRQRLQRNRSEISLRKEMTQKYGHRPVGNRLPVFSG